MIAFLGALVLTFASFGPVFQTPAPRVYDVMLSSDFTATDIATFVAGERSWADVLPGELLLRNAIGECEDNDPRGVDGTLICVDALNSAGMAALTGIPDGILGVAWHSADGMGPWRIVLDVEVGPRLPQEIVQQVDAHELGHAMGLVHNPRMHTLMYPYVRACDEMGHCALVTSLVPTEADVVAWRRLRVRT